MSGGEARKIPIKRDQRTLEQQHRDVVSKLRDTESQRAIKRHEPVSSHWVDDMSRWADSMVDDMWNREMRRLHDYTLPLVPLDMFGPSPYDMFTPFGDAGTILHRMNRQAEAMRQLMDSRMAEPMMTEELVPFTNRDPWDYLQNAYEPGEDGRVHFKLRFNLKGYSPEDIEVKTSENGLTVHAKKMEQTKSGQCSREFSRTMYLPPSVDKEHFQSHLSNDGVLTVEAPVVSERQKAIKLGRDSRLGIKPHAEAHADKTLALHKTNKPGMSVIPSGDGGEKVHLEVPLEPEFTPDDVCVRIDGNRILISGKKEMRDETPTSKSSYLKEFTRTYDIPQSADTLAINAQMVDNTLLVEAPLLRAAEK